MNVGKANAILVPSNQTIENVTIPVDEGVAISPSPKNKLKGRVKELEPLYNPTKDDRYCPI